MSDEAKAQSPPQSGRERVIDRVVAFLQERAATGEKKYGTALQTFNGRDAQVDLLQELGDALMYEMQRRMEGDAVREALRGTPGEGIAPLDEAVRTLAEAWRTEKSERLARVEGLEAERDSYRWDAQALRTQLTVASGEWTALKARLERSEKEAAEAVEREGDTIRRWREQRDRDHAAVRALEAEVTRLAWVAEGAPMGGEPTTAGASPFDGHPFAPSAERPGYCATCGYPGEPSDRPHVFAAATTSSSTTTEG